VGVDPERLAPPEPLAPHHDLASFESGVELLDEWLKRRARRNEESGASRTYVVCAGPTVVGYYALAAGAVTHAHVPSQVRRNMPEPIPEMVLGRLAVDRRHQGRGLGRALLRDAGLRVLRAADLVGVRAILVHAISVEAKRFYLSSVFIESPVDPMTLCLVLETARRALAEPDEGDRYAR
jgi:GNAT superfamily N-acetyltransferase